MSKAEAFISPDEEQEIIAAIKVAERKILLVKFVYILRHPQRRIMTNDR